MDLSLYRGAGKVRVEGNERQPNDHDPAGVAPKDENRSHGYTRMDTDVS